MRNILKKCFFLLIIAALFMPLLQAKLKVFKEPGLYGVTDIKPRIPFTVKKWVSGEYQTSFENTIAVSIGFRNSMVKLYNQIYFSAFKESTNESVEIGKNLTLYEKPFTNSYLGKDYVGEQKIDSVFSKIKMVQDSIEANNQVFLFVCVPSKAQMIPENLPAKYDLSQVKQNNHGAAMIALKRKGINLIDFSSYFMEHKKSFKYPLFPDKGIHWNAYCATLATDSIISFLQKRLQLSLRKYKINKIEVSNQLKEPDYDLGNLLNLKRDIPHESMPYPEIYFDDDSSAVRPEILTIGDSFYWNVRNTGIFEKLFTQPSFWYYNNIVYPESYKKELLVKNTDTRDILKRKKIIIILACDATLVKIADDFANIYQTNIKK